jgi:hypothetical protein
MIRTSHSVLGTFDLRPVRRAAGRCPEPAQTRARPNVVACNGFSRRPKQSGPHHFRGVESDGYWRWGRWRSRSCSQKARPWIGVACTRSNISGFAHLRERWLFGSFVVAMTVSLFIMDRVAQAVGPVWVYSGLELSWQ